MLEKGIKELPKSIKDKGERFEIPNVKGHIQGNKTVISNFIQIAGVLRRKPEHMLKFVLKELAAPGEIKKIAVIIGRKVSAVSVNEKIHKYADEFVICPECGKPDTQLMKEGKVMFKRCLACGAKHPVKAKI